MIDMMSDSPAVGRRPRPPFTMILDLGGRLWRQAVLYRLERRAAAELSRMNDAQLRDIGLRREDIRAAVGGRAAVRRDLY